MKEKYIAGVFATITWDSSYDEQQVYISFAPEPSGAHDCYGVADENIFYYATHDELAELMEPYNGSGWRITEIQMTNIIKHVTPNGWYQSELSNN